MNILGIGLLVFQVQLASISGTVTKPGSNEPLPGATAILRPASAESPSLARSLQLTAERSQFQSAQNSRLRFAITGDDGRFTVGDIEPGDYRLLVQSPLYGGVAYGQRRPDGPGAILTIKAGQALADLKISMAPTGTIAGRVTGRGGEPLAYARVQALRFGYQEGKLNLTATQITTTDDRGEYRLFWLSSGRYVVVASAAAAPMIPGATTPPIRPGGIDLTGDLPFQGRTGLPIILGARQEGTSFVKHLLDDGTLREESWLPTYYPATTDRTQATPVDVVVGSTAGASVTGINITLGPSPVQKVRGRVSNGNQVTVTLLPAAEGTDSRLINTTASVIDGSFEFSGIIPGPYYLTAQNRNGLVATPIAVLVGDRDVENLALAMAPAITLSAHVALEGVTPGTPDGLTGLVGTLRSELVAVPRATLTQRNSQLGPGNRMNWTNVPPGNYQLSLQQPALREDQKRFHIKSIRLGREDAFETIRVSPGTTDVLEVVLTTESGSVEGTAIGRAGDPAANVTIVLVPANARKRTSLYSSLVTGNDGKFRFQEVPTGDYKLFAWDDVETGAWANAEFIAPYESRGRAVRISGNGKEEVQLNVIYNR